MDQSSDSKKAGWRGSRSYNITVNIILVLLAILSYILFLILFLSPQSYHISSFIYVEKGSLPPASAVTLINTLLGATTSAIVGRCIEQSLWLKLTRRASGKPLTVKESRRLAAWGSSSKARITYCFNGASLLLKLSGPFMIGMAIVSTVLTFGISSAQIPTVRTEFLQNQTGIWAGWLDAANDDYNGGNFEDVPGVVAALASLNNLTAPASPACSDSGCYTTAAAVSIHASCAWSEKQYTKKLHVPYSPANKEFVDTFRSAANPQICIQLDGAASPYSYANFSTGPPPGCSSQCKAGDFGVIFGVFVNATDTLNGPWYLNTVDCTLTYGMATVTQNGTSTPSLVPGSFQKSSTAPADVGYISLQRIYTEADKAPYTFSASSGTGDQADSLYNSPVATLLLHAKANTSAQAVAAQIEDIFDLATLLAFSREPGASDLEMAFTTTRNQYIYEARVLAILLVPLMATLLGTWGRWRVEGDEVVLGYNPVKIAMRGPVEGAPQGSSGTEDDVDEKQVMIYKEKFITPHGVQGTVDRFVVGDEF